MSRATKCLRERLHSRDPHCAYCNRFLDGDRLPTLDHIKPRVQGGATAPENLIIACGRCNQFQGQPER